MPAQSSFTGFTDRERHLNEIRNLYWCIRALRPFEGARRRKLYRLIEKQKAVLIADGLDSELLRLWCRQYTNCKPEAARGRLAAYLLKNNILLKETLTA